MELGTYEGNLSADETAQEVIRCFEMLQGNRGNLNSQCQEIAERIWPNHSRLFRSGSIAYNSEGEKRTEELFDTTACNALDKFTSIMDSMLTPANQTWHHTVPIDPYLLKDRDTKLWFEDLTRGLFRYRYAANSNFQAQNQLVYKSEGAYGTGSLYPDFLKDMRGNNIGIRYRHIHLSEGYIATNHQGIVDTFYRYFYLTARQAMQMFDRNMLPEEIMTAARTQPHQRFNFIHCVKPRIDYDPERVDAKGMPFVSYYVSETGKKLLEESGYDTFPYPTARYEQCPGEDYGRSPAMNVLPGIKTLNEMKKTILTQGHRAVEPVLLAYDDGIVDTFSVRPNAVNAGGVSSDGRPLVHALPVGNLAIGKELMDDERNDIKEPFLVQLFQILVENPTMTATEVMERVKEKGILMAPTMGRQYAEYHSPLIEREISLLSKLGALPKDVPPALIEAGGLYTVRYESPMTRTQRAEEASGGMRVLDSAISISTQTGDPSPMDHFNFDEMIPDLADIHGVPEKWRNGKDKIAQIRQSRADNAQKEQEIRAAPGAAAIMKSGAVVKKAANE